MINLQQKSRTAQSKTTLVMASYDYGERNGGDTVAESLAVTLFVVKPSDRNFTVK